MSDVWPWTVRVLLIGGAGALLWILLVTLF
jgi:hypothetical protein